MLGVLNGETDKSPDFSLAFLKIERMRFLIGETGYSDNGALTRRRVQEWLTNGQGNVTIYILEDN